MDEHRPPGAPTPAPTATEAAPTAPKPKVTDWLSALFSGVIGIVSVCLAGGPHAPFSTPYLGSLFLVMAALIVIANVAQLAGRSAAVAEYIVGGGLALAGAVLLIAVHGETETNARWLGIAAVVFGLVRVAVQSWKERIARRRSSRN